MENTNQTPPALTLTDLQVLRNIVELAINRGTFKADEITVVGQHYDKINSWLAHVLSQTQQPSLETTIAEPAQPEVAAKTTRASSTKKSPAKQKGKK